MYFPAPDHAPLGVRVDAADHHLPGAMQYAHLLARAIHLARPLEVLDGRRDHLRGIHERTRLPGRLDRSRLPAEGLNAELLPTLADHAIADVRVVFVGLPARVGLEAHRLALVPLPRLARAMLEQRCRPRVFEVPAALHLTVAIHTVAIDGRRAPRGTAVQA